MDAEIRKLMRQAAKLERLGGSENDRQALDLRMRAAALRRQIREDVER